MTPTPEAVDTKDNYGKISKSPSKRQFMEKNPTLGEKDEMRKQNKIKEVKYRYESDAALELGMSLNQGLCEMARVWERKIERRLTDIQSGYGSIFPRKISNVDSTAQYSLASLFKEKIAKHRENFDCPFPNYGCSDSSSIERGQASFSKSEKTKTTMQGTIIKLVVLMAVSLLSMSALIVADGNSGIHARIELPNQGGDDIGAMKKIINIPRHQPGAPPLHDMCLHGGCRYYCCDKDTSFATEMRHGGFDPSTVKPLSGSKKAFLAAIAGAEKMSPTAFFPKPLPSGTRFEVEGMNMTIDSRYCTERSCNEKKGRYHLFVPVSPYMPTTAVMLRITPPSGMFVESCGQMHDFQEEECPSEGGSMHFTLNMPTALEARPTEVESNLFEISAGSYKRSGYRFRVGTNTESCFGSQDLFKSSYEEYNIIFYRTCGDDIDRLWNR